MIAKTRMRLICLVATVVLCAPLCIASQREITSPFPDEYIFASPSMIGFAYNGRLGFTPSFTVNGGAASTRHLLSFSTTEARVLEAYDLVPEIGLGPYTLQLTVHGATGRVLLLASAPAGLQRLVAFVSDADGHLSKIWAAEYPAPFDVPAVLFSEDGSRVFLFHIEAADETPQLTLLRAGDGATLDTISLPQESSEGSMVFDKANNRLVLVTFAFVRVFKPGTDRLEVDWVAAADPAPHRALGITKDGRFLITYSGFEVNEPSRPTNNSNNYYSVDLERREFHVLSLPVKLTPSVPALTFDSLTDTLFVPLSVKVKVKKDGFTACSCGVRQADIITVGPNGALVRSSEVEIPEQSSGLAESNSITAQNNVAVSQSGALGLLSARNGRVFSFDTMTGEIVDEQSVPNELTFIYRPGDLDVLVYATPSTTLGLLEIRTGPAVSSVEVSKKKTVIKGVNFLFGAHVLINGEDLGVVERDSEDPGRRIIVRRGKKNLPRDQDISVVVVNRDGLRSQPLTFRL